MVTKDYFNVNLFGNLQIWPYIIKYFSYSSGSIDANFITEINGKIVISQTESGRSDINYLQIQTRKSSCVNTRGISTAAYQVLHMLSYPGGGGGRYLGVPPVLTWMGG